MPSNIDSLCRSVRDLLNHAPDGTYSGLFANWAHESPATWQHIPEFDREDLEDMRVVVSSDPENSHTNSAEQVDRCCEHPFVYTVFVGCMRLATTQDDTDYLEYSDKDELEGMKQLMEEMAVRLYSQPAMSNNVPVQVQRMDFRPFFDVSLWRSERVFRSILTVQYL